MADWPDIEPADFGMGEEVYLPQIKTEFEAGYVQSRKKFGVSKERFNQIWGSSPETAMPEGDWQTLKTFFKENQGGVFNWTHPYTGDVYVCRFSSDELKGSWVAPGYRKVECPIEEV